MKKSTLLTVTLLSLFIPLVSVGPAFAAPKTNFNSGKKAAPVQAKPQAKALIKTEAEKPVPAKNTLVIETTEGTFECRLFPEIAPKACQNIVQLAERGYYNGLIFHRVMKGFMIQGGDPLGTGYGGESAWGRPFKDEFSPAQRFDRPGILAMANAGKNTNGSQFFVTVKPTPGLNDVHTIFGEVTKGYDVVVRISETPVNSDDRPLTDVRIITLSAKE